MLKRFEISYRLGSRRGNRFGRMIVALKIRRYRIEGLSNTAIGQNFLIDRR